MRSTRAVVGVALAVLVGAACGGSSDGGGGTKQFKLTVTKAGTGTGTVTSTPAGIDCGATCSASFDEGAKVTLAAAAGTGATFSGFSGGCTGTTCVVTVSADAAVTATFAAAPAAKHTLRVFAWGGGNTTPAPGIYTYDAGTVVTLTATANSGATFTGWSDGTTQTTTQVTLDGDKLVGARFWSGTPGASGLAAPEVASPVTKPTSGSLKVLNWAGFKAAVSYTFDDARSSQALGDDGAAGANYATLKAEKVPMTFFVSPSQVERYLSFWQGVANDGQEIANHTEDHCMVNADGTLVLNPDSSKSEQGCAYKYGVSETTQTAMDEIDAANAYIKTKLGQDAFTMASPYGDADWAQFAQAAGMLMMRNVWSSYNTDHPYAPALDLTQQFSVPGVWFGPVEEFNAKGESQGKWGELGDTATVIDGVIDEVEGAGGWSTFLIHRVTPAPVDDADGCCAVPAAEIALSMQHLKGLKDVWGAKVVDVAAYWIGQKLVTDALASAQVSGDTTTLRWTLPANFPPGKYVRVTVGGATPSQGGKDLAWDTHGYYEVALDAGSLTVKGATVPAGSPCIEVSGATSPAWTGGPNYLGIKTELKQATDFSGLGYTASFDIYLPGTETQPTTLQLLLTTGSGMNPQASWNAYSGIYGHPALATDQWVHVSIPLILGQYDPSFERDAAGAEPTKVGSPAAYPSVTVVAGTHATLIFMPADTAASHPVHYYLKNFQVKSSSATALDFQVQPGTSYASTFTSASGGTLSPIVTTSK